MKKLSKKLLSAVLAITLAITTLVIAPLSSGAATPQSLESYTFDFWADPENTLTQEDVTAFKSGTPTTMVGAVGVYRIATSGNYYLFLPSNANCNNLKVWFTATSASVTADGTTTQLTNGEATSAFSAINEGGVTKTYTITLDTSSYTVTAMKSGQVGAVYIDTTSGSMSTVASSSSHTASEAGTILVVDADGNINYDGEMEKIQGRGNGTWSTSNAKNPYNIKLAVSTSLLGMPKAKKWCLLANNNDKSLVKNQLTYDFAEYIGVKYQPHCKPVDVYMNQQYYGSFQLSEKVEIKSNRINVTDAYENLELENGTDDEVTGLRIPADLSGAPASAYNSSNRKVTISSYSYAAMCTVGNRKYSTNQAGTSSGSSSGIGSIGGIGGIGGTTTTGPALVNPTDITGGYLYELEISKRWVEENAGFCAYNRQGWVVKSCDVATKEMIDYSYNLLYALGSSVYNSGVVPSEQKVTTCSDANSSVRTTTNPAPAEKYQGMKWDEILDADSAVKYYWTQEFFKNMDSATSSTYFYKDSDDIDPMLYAGPVWDMDNSFGYEGGEGFEDDSRWGEKWVNSDGWYTKIARIYRFYANDGRNDYTTDSQAPLNFYAALATNCPDFWARAKSYWYTYVKPATEVLLGTSTDPKGNLHSIDYYVNTVSLSNTMDNVRLQLNNGSAYDYSNMVTSMCNWIQERDSWIDSQFPTANIANAVCSAISAQACTGSPIKPEFNLSYNGTKLIEGVDYTVVYSNNIAVGEATISITGQGMYNGEKTINFTISKGSISDFTVTIPQEAYSTDSLFAEVRNSDGKLVNRYLTYQWKVDNINIDGATENCFRIDDSCKGKTITVEVSGDGINFENTSITSNGCQVSNDEKPRGITKTIASWDYDYSSNPDALVSADDTGLEYYYMATGGEYAPTAELTASVDAQTASKIKWSGTQDLYENTSTTITPTQSPVMGTSKNDLLAWGEYPYFETTVSTLEYENILFSAKLGGTKKAPRQWQIQYSIDGVDYMTVADSAYTVTSNKVMENSFDSVLLPAPCNNRSKVYIRIVACEDMAINGIDSIIGATSGDMSVNNIAIVGTSMQAVTSLEAPTITTTSTNGDDNAIFDTDNVVITDNNGGADIYYSVNGGEAVLYEGAFNPFDSTTAVKGQSVTIDAYASFEDVVSQSVSSTITFAGVNISSFTFRDYSKNVSNGTVFSTGGAYGNSGRFTGYTDGVSQYVPLWNSSKGAFCVSPDDGAKWSSESGFTYEISTVGYDNITFTAKAYTTAKGPNSVSLQYSVDANNWTTVMQNVQLNVSNALEPVFTTVALPSECADRDKVYVRLATTEDKTHGDDIDPIENLHNNNSKGNLYVNDVVFAGNDNGNLKMPYTNKTSDYFGSGAITYYSADNKAMYYSVSDAESNEIASGEYPVAGIVISTLEGFDATTAGPYTVSISESDGENISVVNTREYYYKGETVTKFNYSNSARPLANYLINDGLEAVNTSGANAGTLSMCPDGATQMLLAYENDYGVKMKYSADNPFTTTKNLDDPSNNGYWLIQTSSKGYTNLTLNLEQISGNNAPRDWGLAYSLDGVDYTYIPQSNARAISDDLFTGLVETYNNFRLPTECDDKDDLYIKVFINGGESVNGTELELVSKGSTYINNIELSGIAIPVYVDVTINTVALESKNATTGTLPVDTTITIGQESYTTTNGTVVISMLSGTEFSASASVNGTFANTVCATALENTVLTIPVVAIDAVADGVINGKDYVMIKHQGTSQQKEILSRSFQNLFDIDSENFIYTN